MIDCDDLSTDTWFEDGSKHVQHVCEVYQDKSTPIEFPMKDFYEAKHKDMYRAERAEANHDTPGSAADTSDAADHHSRAEPMGGGNRLRLKSHPMAHQAPRLLADIMDTNSTTAVAMPERIELPVDHPKFVLKSGK